MGKSLAIACTELFAEKMKSLSVQQVSVRGRARNAFVRSPEWKAVASRVLERDGKKCSKCGSDKKINVDHIIPRSKVPELALDELNLRVLCWPCNSAKNTRVEVDHLL